jgi:uncharacterized protein (TIGR02646 family)
MRAIQKGQGPQSLVQHRANEHADYDNYQQKDDLRLSLAAEQGGICCYCMQRIRPTPETMKIEHWRCQTNYPDQQLDYANLLGACPGGQGRPPNLQHCDTSKGDRDICRNPANPAHNVEAFVSFLADGTIESSDATFNDEIQSVLNLNLLLMKRNRRAALDTFKQTLAGRGGLNKGQLEREYVQWSSAGQGGLLPEYCQVVLYWLRKRIARA